MYPKKRSPAPRSSADRAGNIDSKGNCVDKPEHNLPPTISPPVRFIADRYRRSVATAKVICELAKIGGDA